MHYYPFNIADYRKDTQHLSPMEHYIYRELMDWYYLDESPIPKKTQRVLRRLRLGSESVELLQNVLDDFFIETDSGWVNSRIEHELDQYRYRAEAAKVNGSKGGRPRKPRKTQPVILANPDLTQIKPNQEPRTKNQDKDIGAVAPSTQRKKFIPPTDSEVGEYLAERGNHTIDPHRFIDYYQTQGWKLANGRPMVDWKAAVRTWINREKANAKNQSGSGGQQRKLTPAERVRQRHAEIYGSDPTSEASPVGTVVAIQ